MAISQLDLEDQFSMPVATNGIESVGCHRVKDPGIVGGRFIVEVTNLRR